METRVYLPGLRPYELLVQIFPMYGPLLFPVFFIKVLPPQVWQTK